MNISPLESPPEKHFMCEGGPVTKPLSNFEWEQFFVLIRVVPREVSSLCG
ncbi:hypothetical protein LM700876_140382 [Listeria monocytogenes]|nr:hypothetical protein LM1000505_130477 [Listeria monocytogenes]CUK36357.1 hypothetical protein LM500172_110139 [Listeria monocytogenes]CUK50409.1 hypothetical protein LM500704_110532 [Listeria monocytogenes]CUK59629.1 hypothetical protein LM600918_100420 [Listeria monocytogenes]CUK66095.1 hypothetical protein LM601023_170084 [Listeria monocytogenes]